MNDFLIYIGRNKRVSRLYPCEHGGTCTDKVADFECSCREGWTGKRCETPVEYCDPLPCLNGGVCFNLTDDFFCRCQGSTTGETCGNFPKSVVLLIHDVERTAQCNCDDDYAGTSCQLIKDHCAKPDMCNNEGQCVTNLIGFKCECDDNGTMDNCIFCDKLLENGEQTVKLGKKGCDNINKISSDRQQEILTVPGLSVHHDCRRDFINLKSTRWKTSVDVDTEISTPERGLRSSKPLFKFKENCLFCGQTAKNYKRKRGYDVVCVRTLEFQSSVESSCRERNDKWGEEVLSRIQMAHSDLHAADAVYHAQCNSNFRTSKQMPQTIAKTPEDNLKKRKISYAGRPKNDIAENGFQAIMLRIEKNQKQISIAELVRGDGTVMWFRQYLFSCPHEEENPGLFCEADCVTKISAIGHAIIQATRPRSVIAPLQIGLGIQMHHHFSSRFLIDTLFNLGFCSSYSEVQKFEMNAAASRSTENENENQSFVQYIADNVDHNIRSLDGFGTFHGMGIIAASTPGIKTARSVPRTNPSIKEITALAKINIKFYKEQSNSFKKLKYEVFEKRDIENKSWKLDLLSKICWPLKFSASWSAIMHKTSGSYPEQSSMKFLPMIDLNPSDESRIYTTLHFVCKEAKQNKCTPILTFDQPLYWKAMMIVQNEPTTSSLKSLVLKLGGFHAEMSFVGSIGYLMSGSGLMNIFETVYASTAVSHMLSGKAIARAVRGHFLLDTAHCIDTLKYLWDSSSEN
ncbi:unnamed protein product [Mytilus edulis]|uniref:EGF-like domain-containing protein n=1 Tax=Mytilus edulis TaxID=6550 RepID=A0A8S3RV93_MYTED|nr:unnamed protein product [Mytilus edulis]